VAQRILEGDRLSGGVVNGRRPVSVCRPARRFSGRPRRTSWSSGFSKGSIVTTDCPAASYTVVLTFPSGFFDWICCPATS
jgi:hypothetical protein